MGAMLLRRSTILRAIAALGVFATLSGCASLHHEVSAGSRRPIGASAFTPHRPGSLRPVESGVVHHSEDASRSFASRTYLLLRLRERRLYMVTYDLGASAPA